MSNIKVTLPIYWTQEYKTKPDKTVLVGMNFYRNAHYHSQNKLKQYFHGLVEEQLNNQVIDGSFTLHISIYYKNSNCDGANISALMEKFALDALQEHGVVVNDNVKYHKGSTWEIIEQDKENPRCVIEVIKMTKELSQDIRVYKEHND